MMITMNSSVLKSNGRQSTDKAFSSTPALPSRNVVMASESATSTQLHGNYIAPDQWTPMDTAVRCWAIFVCIHMHRWFSCLPACTPKYYRNDKRNAMLAAPSLSLYLSISLSVRRTERNTHTVNIFLEEIYS